MFDGDQYHQFIASSRSSLPIPLSFSLHGNPASNFSTAFDPFPTSLEAQLHHQEPPPPTTKKHVVQKYPLNISTHLGLESERSMDPWSNDEVLALLKVRSSMEIWFPDFTWEHVSRKLSELGYKRSRDECKEKFEEESRHFDSVNFRGNYALDEIYEEEARKSMEKVVDDEDKLVHKNMEKEKNEISEQQVKKVKKRRRSHDKKFEILKGFCESVVKKMMAQQEELQKKLLEDIVKRDDEKIAREEAWKNQEMKRMKMEIEMRSKEQASAEKRQATIIQFLNKFTSSSSQDQNLRNKIDNLILKVNNNSSTTSCKTPNHDEDQEKVENPISALDHQSQLSPPSPSSSKPNYYSVSLLQTASSSDNQTSLIFESSGGDTGKRWPRDEVLALINLRCKMSNINGELDQSNGKVESGAAITKGPLWERISQGMMEMGYKRSAKRCKEKWENINKYFRKTKDSSKKRSVNSRTCPYFHQLSCLYSQGTFVAPNNMQENHQ